MNSSIDPRVSIGHVHLKVADLDRALDFYCGVLGFELTTRMGRQAAFISAGGYHHHIGLNTWESAGGTPGYLWMGRPIMASARRCTCMILTVNGVELYWDRPEGEWPRDSDGSLVMYTRPLDLESLAAAIA